MEGLGKEGRGEGRQRWGGDREAEVGGDQEAELPMALNQLAPLPGSPGGVREALREAGK